VLIGVRADGRKELIALVDGYRESAESWADLLRDCAPPRHARPGAGRRGRRAGVLGRAARGVPPDQRTALLVSQDGQCPGRAAQVRSPGREEGLAEIWNAEVKPHALAAVKAFEAAYGAKFPKAAVKITDDVEELLGVL